MEIGNCGYCEKQISVPFSGAGDEGHSVRQAFGQNSFTCQACLDDLAEQSRIWDEIHREEMMKEQNTMSIQTPNPLNFPVIGRNALVGRLLYSTQPGDQNAYNYALSAISHHWQHKTMPEYSQGEYQGKPWKEHKPSWETIAEYSGRIFALQPGSVGLEFDPTKNLNLGEFEVIPEPVWGRSSMHRIVSDNFAITWDFKTLELKAFLLANKQEAEEFWFYFVPKGWDWEPGIPRWEEVNLWISEQGKHPQYTYVMRQRILQNEEENTRKALARNIAILQSNPHDLNKISHVAGIVQKMADQLIEILRREQEVSNWTGSSSEKSMAE